MKRAHHAAAQEADGGLPGAVHARLLDWYSDNARDLPWRRPGCSPWGVFVSEIMAQQTPIARILSPWLTWMDRWPTPADLAGDEPAEAISAWGRLGYPRRAVALHRSARMMVAHHDGAVPRSVADLRALPGVGEYTAAAVSSFAFGIPEVVIDTNVRRVLARVALGEAQAAPSITRAERDLARSWMPPDRDVANTWNVAAMEFGALHCTARAPRCGECPVGDLCRWKRAGAPAYEGPRRPSQGYVGTDREIRGRLLAVVRGSRVPVPLRSLLADVPDPARAKACVASLVADGLLAECGGSLMLPDTRRMQDISTDGRKCNPAGC